MSIDRIEIWVHDHILKNDNVRHMLYGLYQRAMYIISPKIEYEGDVERITPDDGYEYLFGYYDKCPWSYDGKYLLALRVKEASKKADSVEPAEIVRIELSTRKMEILAITHSWNVQQGCMAQWLSDEEILYNDFRQGSYCAVILNIKENKERIISKPVYAMSPDKKTALSLDFSRLHRLRPGYGYANIPETTKDQKCPDASCIWKIDINTGEVTPLLKYTDFATFEPKKNMVGAEHKVNHLMISPNGHRFMVLHRWYQNGVKYTRLITCSMDGSNMYNLSDDDFVSHCCWKNDEEILSYLNKKDGGKGYYLLKDKTHIYERCWVNLPMDGHPSYSYDGKYVVTDTYPNRRRIQSLYVMEGNRVSRLAQVFSPFKYGGDMRCDLHPRWSRDGMQICFDASFGGRRSVCIVKVNRRDEIVTNKGPLVSVIVPCYNCQDTIEGTIKSITDQTYNNVEIICVDDGSSDRTGEILMELSKKGNASIRIIVQENLGVSAARNNGIRNSKGKYIMFCDSDDMFNPNMIEMLVTAILETNADTSYCLLSRNYNEVMGQTFD